MASSPVAGTQFTECQAPRKKPQSIGISPVSLHAFMKTWLFGNSQSDSYDKNDMKEKVNDLG